MFFWQKKEEEKKAQDFDPEIKQIVYSIQQLETQINFYTIEAYSSSKDINQISLDSFHSDIIEENLIRVPRGIIDDLLRCSKIILSNIAIAEEYIKNMRYEFNNKRTEESRGFKDLHDLNSNLKEDISQLTTERDLYIERIEKLSLQVSELSNIQDNREALNREVTELQNIVKEYEKKDRETFNKYATIKDQLEQKTRECQYFDKEVLTMRKSVKEFSVPVAYSNSVDNETHSESKFQSLFKDNQNVLIGPSTGNNKILKNLVLFLQPNEICEQAKTCKSIKHYVLGKFFTLPVSIKNAGFEEKRLEFNQFDGIRSQIQTAFAPQENEIARNARRYLVYDYNINEYVDKCIEDILAQLDYLLQGYTNAIPQNNNKGFGRARTTTGDKKLKLFGENFMNMFKDKEAEKYEQSRKNDLNLRITRAVRSKNTNKGKVDEILNKTCFENFLFIKDDNKRASVKPESWCENQNKHYKQDIDLKISEFFITMTNAVNRYSTNDFENLKQLLLFLVKETCRSTILLQFMSSEVSKLLEFKDFLYCELLHSQIAYAMTAHEAKQIKPLNKKIQDLLMIIEGNKMMYNIDDQKIKGLEANLFEKDLIMAQQSAELTQHKHKQTKYRAQNHDLKNQIITATNKMQNYEEKNTKIEEVEKILEVIFKEIPI